MKKSAKISLAMALMVGATTGLYTIAPPQEASAEISDKFRLEVNGIISHVSDNSNLGGFAPENVYDKKSEHYWSNYTRLQLQYHESKNIKYQFRLHSGYESYSTNKGSASDAYFDQSFIEIKDPKAKMVYTIGKKGAYLGQGLIHNSTGNLTGAQVSFGNWYDPTCLQLIAGSKKNGSHFFAANFTHQVTKPWQLSLTYIHHDVRNDNYYELNTSRTGNAELYDGSKVYYNNNKVDKYHKLHLLSIGSQVKVKPFTVQGGVYSEYDWRC